jgi:hypothetical protein
MQSRVFIALVGVLAAADGSACSSTDSGRSSAAVAKNPDTAPVVAVDRFSDAAAHLFKRSSNPSMPAPNAPIACDQGPFITHGLGPNGEKVTYYNFDVLPTAPAPIYAFFVEGSSTPVAGQLNVIDVLPGDAAYNDFWQVTKVTVPASYVANSVTSFEAIRAAGYTLTPTNMLVNCPVVPDGSTAMLRYTAEPSSPARGWYRDQVVKYFSFDERAITTDASGKVPVAPILVAFNVNPDPSNAMSGPPSGFVAEPGTMQTHNVVAGLPESAAYSPLWSVSAYDSKAFPSVSNWMTAQHAPVVGANLANVNCPVVAKQ